MESFLFDLLHSLFSLLKLQKTLKSHEPYFINQLQLKIPNVMKIDKEKLIEDYENKQTSYYENNYKNKTKGNYIRRLRNDIINDVVETASSFDKVLDAGCGPAILYEALLAKSGKYYALDMVQTNLDEVKNKNTSDKIECIQSDMDSFEWEDNYFDVIICSGSIEYHAQPEANLEKLLAMLKDDGVLICSFPNVSAPYRLWGEYVYCYMWFIKNKVLGKSTLTYSKKLFSIRNIKDICNKNKNLTSTEIKLFGVKALLQPLDAIFRSLDFSLSKYYESSQNRLLKPFCTEFLLIARK